MKYKHIEGCMLVIMISMILGCSNHALGQKFSLKTSSSIYYNNILYWKVREKNEIKNSKFLGYAEEVSDVNCLPIKIS